MKNLTNLKPYKVFHLAICLLCLFALSGTSSIDSNKPVGINYYFDSDKGSNENNGMSPDMPFKSLSKLKDLKLSPGDNVLLSAHSQFKEPLILKNIVGSKDNKIIFSSYSSNKKGKTNDRTTINVIGELNAVSIVDCSFIEIKNILISANPSNENHITASAGTKSMRCGILVKPLKNGITENITFSNLIIEDVFYENPGFKRSSKEVYSANGTQNYGWGLRVINSNKNATIKDIVIKDCKIKNVSHTGIKFTGKNRSIKNITVENCQVIETGGPGIQMSGVEKGHIVNNYVNKSGSNNDSRKWGRGSGLWTWGSSDILIEKNHFLNANGPGDSAGAHIDFNCENIILQYNFSANNAGGFCEILGNNYNCAYRYNISVNDGYRIKGENGAFQEGKTLWLSGFVGKNNKRNGPFNSYIYNNTIYTSKEVVSKYAFDKAASGVLIVNNIFYLEGKSKGVLGDQYKPDTAGKSKIKHVVFENNLFLNETNWPKGIAINDSNPLIGNPKFMNKGGLSIKDYVPVNTKLVKNKGKKIQRITNDKIGLALGLEITHDILGNPIIGSPDIGAIEINSTNFDE